MSDHDPAYIAARELDTTLQKLRGDLCECKVKADVSAKAAEKAKANPLNWLTAVLFAFFVFWLLSRCGQR